MKPLTKGSVKSFSFSLSAGMSFTLSEKESKSLNVSLYDEIVLSLRSLLVGRYIVKKLVI
jgi:hypothetical protein